ncbi:MAG: pro-sigmaK processing inhibitor BofA family protein [Lachnospiraceae bacterium]|nr:pro-sigmaK processing inhibitor BofA family protein [Lachnospiraceae bacterium]
MENWQGAFFIVGVCAIILFILALKQHSHLILNLVYRGVSGTILIFLADQLVMAVGLSVFVGINPGTVLTCTILGFPGVILLFGMKFYGLL